MLKPQQELRKYATKERAKNLQRFFKTGPGEYGEGDVFIGVKVPDTRKVAKEYKDLPEKDILKLLKSPIHEERLLALIILVGQFKVSSEASKKKIFSLYINNTRHINNWDLIDLTAGHIVGEYLYKRDRGILKKFATSKSLWKRRIAVLATSNYIGKNEFSETIKIARILLNDDEDLIHKAVGWMLREVGKRDLKTEEDFLKKHYKTMPRTMLRYAIERFPERKRKAYLHGTV